MKISELSKSTHTNIETIRYYEKQGFVNEGLSQSTFAGETWYDMVWEAKK